MSSSIFEQMQEFHRHYGFDRRLVEIRDRATLIDFLDFRISMMQEEIFEIVEALDKKDPEGVVDGIIDLIVFAAGTLDLFDVDGDEAWMEVWNANMNKSPGVKEGRENPYDFPDLIKPEGWKEPNHSDNTGRLEEVLRGH